MNIDEYDHRQGGVGGGSSSLLLPRPSSEESEEWTVEGDDELPTPEGFFVDHRHHHRNQHIDDNNNNNHHHHHRHVDRDYSGTLFGNGVPSRASEAVGTEEESMGLVRTEGDGNFQDHQSRRPTLPGISEERGGDGGIDKTTSTTLYSFLDRPGRFESRAGGRGGEERRETNDEEHRDGDGGCDSSNGGGGGLPRSSSSSGPIDRSCSRNPMYFPIPQNDDEYDDVIPPIYSYTPHVPSGMVLTYISRRFVPRHRQQTHGGSALAGFLALLLVTCANCMLGPMRDAAALAVGVSHIPALTLASTVLALGSSVPVGWLFEAPDPRRRRVWKRMGLTRGETQGTSLALFYRVFAFLLLSYALGFVLVDRYGGGGGAEGVGRDGAAMEEKEEGEEGAISLIAAFSLRAMAGIGVPVARILKFAGGVPGMRRIIEPFAIVLETCSDEPIPSLFLRACARVVNKFGKVIYIMFFLVVHLMKLHSLSLIWGVTTEAMEYEESAEQRRAIARERGGNSGDDDEKRSPPRSPPSSASPSKSSLRLKRLGFVGFGGTLGGILGSVIASFAAHILHLSGLLIVAAIFLEISANLSVELGRIMQRHWEEQMKHASNGDLASLASAENLAAQVSKVDSSMRRSASMGSMKRVASGSLSSGNLLNLAAQQEQQERDRSRDRMATAGGAGGMKYASSTGSIPQSVDDRAKMMPNNPLVDQQPMIDDITFKQRLMRGVTTILRSRLLMSIFTYNALSASASVLLSFQRAELVANRSTSMSSAVSNTAFLAKINTASSVAVFALQASGLGAYIADCCGQRGALALMPVIRLCGVTLLGWWHLMSDGRPPDLIMFLVIDEFAKVINFAIAKPVRENLWRGLSAEARYEAKPIVDTLANRWGGGSAAFLVSFINGITDLTGLGVVNENTGERSICGFPPILLLCMIISTWWFAVSADVGNIRRKIDLELKKQQ